MSSPHVTIKMRQTGARATIGRVGRARVASATGGEVEIVTSPSEPGFNPLDLLYASLAACLVLSTRIAASRLGLLDRLEQVEVDVSGEKSHEEPFSIERFHVGFTILGDFDDAARETLAHAAEEICTVSNTLKAKPIISVSASSVA